MSSLSKLPTRWGVMLRYFEDISSDEGPREVGDVHVMSSADFAARGNTFLPSNVVRESRQHLKKWGFHSALEISLFPHLEKYTFPQGAKKLRKGNTQEYELVLGDGAVIGVITYVPNRVTGLATFSPVYEEEDV